jgi:hypothetical protein
MYDITTNKDLLELEKAVWEDECEHWSPHLVLDLIDEIKRLRGWKILRRPENFQPDPPLKPVEFDFSELE